MSEKDKRLEELMEIQRERAFLAKWLARLFGAVDCEIEDNRLKLIFARWIDLEGYLSTGSDYIYIKLPLNNETKKIWDAMSQVRFKSFMEKAGFPKAKRRETGFVLPIDEVVSKREVIRSLLEDIVEVLNRVAFRVLSTLTDEYVQAWLASQAIKEEKKETE